MKGSRFPLAALRVAALFGSVVTFAAYADSFQDAQQLLKKGQPAQALERVDQVLAGKPKDAQARFLKGVILTELNRPAEAIAVFQKLTEDYPELPEPYNNLAVIYAQQRQYDKAKLALEMAIRTHPSYATAHENLGDVYARLASQAYDKALQLDSGNAAAQAKLASIRELMSVSGRPGTPRPTAVAAVPAQKQAVAAASGPRPAEVKPAAPAAKPAAPAPVAAPKPAETPKAVEPPKPAPAPEATFEATPAADEAEVGKAVRDWAAAWSRKDVKAYFAHYGKEFQAPGGRTAWEKERARRIDKPGAIEVRIDNLRIAGEGADRAVARFRQHYKAAGLSVSSNKTLVLVRRDGRWLIVQERVGA